MKVRIYPRQCKIVSKSIEDFKLDEKSPGQFSGSFVKKIEVKESSFIRRLKI